MSSITTDNSKSSCSKTNIANEFSDNDSDIDDYNHSETEMQNIGEFATITIITTFTTLEKIIKIY